MEHTRDFLLLLIHKSVDCKVLCVAQELKKRIHELRLHIARVTESIYECVGIISQESRLNRNKWYSKTQNDILKSESEILFHANDQGEQATFSLVNSIQGERANTLLMPSLLHVSHMSLLSVYLYIVLSMFL